MGNCVPPNKKQNSFSKQINYDIKKQTLERENETKILFLGKPQPLHCFLFFFEPGMRNAGKSSVLRNILSSVIQQLDRETYLPIIHRNIITTAKSLLFVTSQSERSLSKKNKEAKARIEESDVLEMTTQMAGLVLFLFFFLLSFLEDIERILKDRAVKGILKNAKEELGKISFLFDISRIQKEVKEHGKVFLHFSQFLCR